MLQLLSFATNSSINLTPVLALWRKGMKLWLFQRPMFQHHFPESFINSLKDRSLFLTNSAIKIFDMDHAYICAFLLARVQTNEF